MAWQYPKLLRQLQFLKYFLLGFALTLLIVIIHAPIGLTQNSRPDLHRQAQTLTDKAHQQLVAGYPAAAIKTWQQAAQLYQKIHNSEGIIGSLINQSVGFQALGQYPRACTTLIQALKIDSAVCPTVFQPINSPAVVKELLGRSLSRRTLSPAFILGLKNLGDSLRQLSQPEISEAVLERGLALVQSSSTHYETSGLLLSLANTQRVAYNKARSLYQRQDTAEEQDVAPLHAAIIKAKLALDLYQKAKGSSATIALEASLNQLSLLLDIDRWTRAEMAFQLHEAESLYQEIHPQILPLAQQLAKADFSKLPPLDSSFAHQNLAMSLLQLSKNTDLTEEFENGSQAPAQVSLTHAQAMMQVAKTMGNQRLESAAAGLIGRLHSALGNSSLSQTQLETALGQAIAIEAWDLAYQWQDELGQLYEQQGNYSQAAAMYKGAVASLEQVRGELLSVEPEYQFSFQEKVEPVYQRYLRLLLASDNPSLSEAIQVNGQLRLAELENYLQCGKLALEPLDQIESAKHPATFFFILNLGDRYALIVRDLAGKLHHFTADAKAIEFNANFLLSSLSDANLKHISEPSFLPYAQALYMHLIAPARPYLPQSGTLVFTLDSSLQAIPMDILHNGESYLGQHYSSAYTLGSKLRPLKALPRHKLKILLAGLSQTSPSFKSPQAPRGLQPLPGVASEVTAVQRMSTSDLVLVNHHFTSDRLQAALAKKDYPIAHISTHAQFSSDPDRTVILAWDTPIGVRQLSGLVKGKPGSEPGLDLLTLSACETAKGDLRSALGLAGVAVQSGASSTVASLWLVNDESTAILMEHFYKHLKAGIPKAEALHQAQITLIQNPKYSHPYWWAGFVLVGGWV